ncbi:hypothetical protein LIER_23824 [Lithospermum erythrorhizon]|uniref:Uncharacterized protein n=1 Tax=Lithospermum erythrorhizon TaxID=34254 RepID=A0AAV3R1T4_LITER
MEDFVREKEVLLRGVRLREGDGKGIAILKDIWRERRDDSRWVPQHIIGNKSDKNVVRRLLDEEDASQGYLTVSNVRLNGELSGVAQGVLARGKSG